MKRFFYPHMKYHILPLFILSPNVDVIGLIHTSYQQDSNTSPVVHFAPESPRTDDCTDTLPPPPGQHPFQQQQQHQVSMQQQQQMAIVSGGNCSDASPPGNSAQVGNNRLQVISPRPGSGQAGVAGQRKTCIQNPEVQVRF